MKVSLIVVSSGVEFKFKITLEMFMSVSLLHKVA